MPAHFVTLSGRENALPFGSDGLEFATNGTTVSFQKMPQNIHVLGECLLTAKCPADVSGFTKLKILECVGGRCWLLL